MCVCVCVPNAYESGPNGFSIYKPPLSYNNSYYKQNYKGLN